MQNKFLNKNALAFFFFIGLSFFCLAQSKTFNIDGLKSQINFQVKHLGVLNVDGKFHNFFGRLVFFDNELKEITATIKVNSIDTSDKTRDETLMGKVYFNVAEYPDISFTSIKIENTLNSRTIVGLLKIKDIEKEIGFPFQYKRLKETNMSSIKISITIYRKDFRLDFGVMDALIGDTIKVELELVFH